MNVLKHAVLLCMLVFPFVAGAQIVKDPTTWTVEAKKTGANTYDLVFKVKLEPTWHIYSLKPGGDGTLLAPEFNVEKNAKVKLNGKVKEKGKLVKKKIEGIDGIVNYYSTSVEYVQSITVSGVPKITGSYRYQVCTDEMCLPPKKKKFEVALK